MKLVKNWILPPGADPEDPKIRSNVGKRSGILGILANLLLFAAKFTIGTISGAVSITADAMNNLSDASSAVVTLLGFRLAEIPPDEKHPFGHARFEYLSALAVSAMIVVIGVELVQTSFQKILHPEAVLFSPVAALVLILSILVKLLLAGTNLSLGKAIDSATLTASGIDSRNDCIATAAVLACAIVSAVTHWQLDGYVGLAVALFILWSGAELAKDTISPLLGERADPEVQRSIVHELKKEPKILGFHDMMIHDYGPGQRFASVHAEMDMREDPLECHSIIDDVERRVLENHKIHLVIHYDPVVTDDLELNKMRAQVAQVLESIHPQLNFHDFRMVRGDSHVNLIFDMTLPGELVGQEDSIKRMLDTAINLNADTTYYTVITFDSMAFNSDEIWNKS